MGSRTRTVVAALSSAVVVALMVGPVAGGERMPSMESPPGDRTIDLAASLGSNGAFRGLAGVSGTVDAGAWTLSSDLTAGEAPRFARGGAASMTTPVGPWSALGSNGSGDGAIDWLVTAIVVSGNNVYVGGFFSNAAGIAAADRVAKWNGVAWSALGSDGAGDGALGGNVYALAMMGGDLYVGGDFTDAAGIAAADKLARWDGSAWSAVGPYPDVFDAGVHALAASGTDLFVGGDFTNAAGMAFADGVVRWTGGTWDDLGSNGVSDGALNDEVHALATLGSHVIVGGSFTDAAGIATADRVATWDVEAEAWAALGSNGAGNGAIDHRVFALAVSSGYLYAGGSFSDAGGDPAGDSVARWDGVEWSGLGAHPWYGGGAIDGQVYAVAAIGDDVYVGGGFDNAAGISAADTLVKWNGAAWSALGSDGEGDGALASRVNALAVSTTGLYVGGQFEEAAGMANADNVAKWALGGPRRPDGRIRLGTSGRLLGNDIYNSNGASQSKTGSAPRGGTITFGISVQNDAAAVGDRARVRASGTSTTHFAVRYFDGPTDITAAVVAGTYQTPLLAAGATRLITVEVRVKTGATIGTEVVRELTIRSADDASKKDVVKFTARRG